MLNIGIIGTGSIANAHIGGYLKFPERAKITALCDIVREKCAEKKEKYALADARIFSSVEEMLEARSAGSLKLDLVSICTPPFTHAKSAILCLEAGLNVLVEKPMASSLEECDAMMLASKKSGRLLSSVAQNRFLKPISALKAALDAGFIGRVLHAQVDSFWWRGFHYYDLWWRGKWDTEGGGCTLNHAVHHIDMLLWMMGEPEKVTAVISNASHSNAEVEDVSVSVLQYPRGALAQITASVIHHGEEQQLIFQGEKARISVPWKAAANVAGPNAFPLPEHDTALEKKLNDFYEAFPEPAYTAHAGQVDNVLTSLETGKPPLVGGKDGRASIELITAIYKAGSTGSVVKLPIEKTDPFYTVKGILANTPRFFEKSASVKDFAGEITTGGNYGRHN